MIKRHLTFDDYKALDPDKVWVFRVETDEEMENLFKGLQQFKTASGRDLDVLILRKDIDVSDLTDTQVEEILAQFKSKD